MNKQKPLFCLVTMLCFKMINKSHWQYFLSLEEELIKISKFIEIDKRNFEVFSLELLKIYLAICSEVDVVLKLLCKKIDLEEYKKLTNNSKNRKNIKTYREIICKNYPDIYQVRVRSKLYKLTFYPWKKFLRNKSPKWWVQYNEVKHTRNEFFRRANLRNSLYSLSGLLVLLNYYCHPMNHESACLSLSKSDVPRLMMISGSNYIGGVSWEGPRLFLPNQDCLKS